MTANREQSHWRSALPLAAAASAALMIALAALGHHTMTERHQLVLDGRLLGLAHSAEIRLRDSGIDGAENELNELLGEGRPVVTGIALFDSDGAPVASAGGVAAANRVRSVDLFLGRNAGGDPQRNRPGPGQPGQRGSGRGRFTLRMHLDPSADTLPLAQRLLLPTVIAAGIALVWLAYLAGRHLDRQRLEIREVAQRRRLEALARAGAGLAHQLRTPLATIKGTSQLMAERCDDDDLRPRVDTVVAQADRMNRLLGRLLDYARPPTPEPQVVEMAEMVAAVAEPYPDVEIHVPDGAATFVDPDHLEEILDNLLANAAYFRPEGTSIEIAVETDAESIRVAVRDHGPGPGDDPETHFEPYQTSRADGTGLGLPIARALAEANRGALNLETPPGGGCRALLLLPGTAGRG